MSLFKLNYINPTLIDNICKDIVNKLNESTIEILNSDDYLNFLDMISSLSETSVSLLNDKDLVLLYEAIGERGLQKIGSMMLNHRTRDEETFHSGKADGAFKPASAYHIFKKAKERTDKMNGYDIKHRLFQRKVESITKKNNSFGKHSDQFKNYVSKKYNDIEKEKAESKANLEKIDRKLGKKYNVSSINKNGGAVNGNFKLTSEEDGHKSCNSRPNVYSMYHDKKNNSRGNAVTRLVNYIDKKGYNDDQYIKKNRENVNRADDAKDRIRDKRGDSAVSGEYHKDYSKKEINQAFGAPYSKSSN